MQETQETQVRSQGLEDSWSRKWQPISIFLPGKSELGGLQSMRLQSVRSDWACTHMLFNCSWFVNILNAFCFTTDYKESWVLKNWCFWTVVLEKTLESPLDCKEIQPVHPKGDQSWVFIGRTDVEAETPILWPPDAKSWLNWKDADAGKYWRQEEEGTTEDEMVGWHHQLNGHEFG